MAYSDIDSVKRVLRTMQSSSKNQYKVRTSESYELPESYSGNSGDIGLHEVHSIASSYAGSEIWVIKFTSDVAFTLYRGEGENLNDGTGNVSADFTSTSRIISINSSDWYGTAQTGDKIKFRTDSNISTDDAEDFISDADAVIDGLLNRQMDLSSLPTITPTLIQKASMYMSANLIYQSVFSNISIENLPSIVRMWYNFATDLISSYLEGISGLSVAKYGRYGRFLSREALFDKVGITEASGVEGMKGEIETVDVPYDEDYNSEESVGST